MKFKLFSVILATTFIAVGCQTTNEEGMNNRDGTDPNIEQTRYNQGDNMNNRDNRDNRADRDRDNKRNENRDGDRTRDGANTRNNDNRDNEGDNDRYNVSEEASDKITDEIDEIDHAYVLTMNKNAYVAANLDNDKDDNNDNKDRNTNDNDNDATDTKTRNNTDNTNNADDGKELTDEVKKQISDIVQSVDNDIDNVYVTTNPDFADLTKDYVNDMNNGKPVRGFFDQIGNMIERVFPQDKR